MYNASCKTGCSAHQWHVPGVDLALSWPEVKVKVPVEELQQQLEADLGDRRIISKSNCGQKYNTS